MYFGDLELPATISKRDAAFGRGAPSGRRSEDIAKALPAPPRPMGGTGPLKKAPVIAGPTPRLALAKPTIPVIGRLARVSKVDVSEESRKRQAKAGTALPGGKFPQKTLAQVRSAEKLENMPSISAGERAAAKQLTARRKKALGMSKARGYDPEDRRQRRLGAEAAGSGIGGALLVRSGANEIRHDTGALRRAPMKIPPLRGKNAPTDAEGVASAERTGKAINRVREVVSGGRGVLVSRRAASKVGAGAGLLAGGAALMADHHKRRWQ